MSTIKEIKGRISSTRSSEKITGAMKMISSAKLRKAENALRQMTPYREQLRSAIVHLLASDGDYPSPLTEKRPVQRMAVVVIGSEEGLCGAFNLYLFKALEERIAELRRTCGETLALDIYPLGKRLAQVLAKMEGVTVHDVSYLNAKSSTADIRQFTDEIIARFLAKEIDAADVIYPYYKSMASQPVKVRTLLPVDASRLAGSAEGSEATGPYIYEPSQAKIFETLVPLFVRTDMQESIYNGRTSEQAARVVAMQSASDNAKKLLEELQLDYNKLRQQGITSELLDIVGGSMQ